LKIRNLSDYFYHKIIQLDGKSHAPLLDYVLLEQQSSFFMTTIQSNNDATMKPLHDYNPMTQMWKRFDSNVILKDKFF
jgi:hypothetical protein